MNKKISIVLCTYNEVNYIDQTIRLISQTLENVEIIVVDDNSNDGTLEKLNTLKSIFNFKLIVRKNERGLASAHKRGFDESTGEYVGAMDGNNKDQILYFTDLSNKLNSGHDIASLSRYIPGGGDQRIFIRSFSSKAINVVSRFFLRIPFSDFTSGIFLMKRKLLDYSDIMKTVYGEWFIEFIYILYKKNYKLIEIPYVQKKDENLQLQLSKSYPNIFTFIYRGCIYFFRIILTIIRN